MHDVLAVLVGLLSGGTMPIALSCIWVVLLIPARLTDRVQSGTPRQMTWALSLGMLLAAAHNAVGFALPLPWIFGCIALLLGGMFVGMLASALGEILEVAPVLMRRFRLGDVSTGVRFVMMIGKALGAVLASLIFTL